MSISVKICGINDPESMHAALEYGAHFVGLVFYPPSPRAIDIEKAASLLKPTKPGTKAVGLFVNPSLEEVRNVLGSVPLDIIQLHGDESPEFISALKQSTNLKVMKAIKLATSDDLKSLSFYEPVADWLLFDAKTPNTHLPGGNAVAFDWTLLKDFQCQKPWMLAGGLNIHNLAAAVEATKTRFVDVSSGVEDSPGNKNPNKIRELLRLAAQL